MNIFEYKPILQYVLQDINTINNLPDSLDSVKPYIINNPAQVVPKLQEVKQSLDAVQANIKNALKNVEVPFNTNFLDNILVNRLSSLDDGLKLVNDGILTYKLYSQISTDPLSQPIIDAWDEYQAGPNGKLEAEIEPFVSESYETLDSIAQVVLDTLLYNINDPLVTSDAQRYKEYELLKIEQYMHALDMLEEAFGNANLEQATNLKKEIDTMEQELTFKSNITTTLRAALTELSSFAQDLYDATIPEYQTIQYNVAQNQVDALKKAINTDDLKLRAIVYSSFMSKYDKVLNQKRTKQSTLPSTLKYAATRGLVRDVRMYRDVAVPTIVNLAHSDYTEAMAGAATEVTLGLERLTSQFDQSMLGYKNMLNTEIKLSQNILTDIFNKQSTRVMYNILGRN